MQLACKLQMDPYEAIHSLGCWGEIPASEVEESLQGQQHIPNWVQFIVSRGTYLDMGETYRLFYVSDRRRYTAEPDHLEEQLKGINNTRVSDLH